jgi:hypothetical protein
MFCSRFSFFFQERQKIRLFQKKTAHQLIPPPRLLLISHAHCFVGPWCGGASMDVRGGVGSASAAGGGVLNSDSCIDKVITYL